MSPMWREHGTKRRCLRRRNVSAVQPTVWFASPGDPTQLTGGYIYNARVVTGLRASGWVVESLRLPDTYPFPTPADQAVAKNLLFRVRDNDLLVVDGLALGAFSPDVLANLRGRLIALVHHPLADESGLDAQQVEALTVSETRALTFARGVIVTSPHTADALAARFGVPRDGITVAVPGVDPVQAQSDRTQPPMILAVGSVSRRKGHDVLVRALTQLVDLEWHAVVVGNLDRDPAAAAEVRRLVSEHGLERRVQLAGEQPQVALSAYYRQATLFALATRHEGYGMVFSEAMMHGLPIVTCAAGAVPDTVPSTAGLLVPPNEPEAFANALRTVLEDSAARTRLASGSLAAGQALPTWTDTARLFEAKLHEVAK